MFSSMMKQPARLLAMGVLALCGMGMILVMGTGPARAQCALDSGVLCNGAPCETLTRSAGTVIFNVDLGVLQSCTESGNWTAMSPLPKPPTGCPNPGDVCSDGTIYAGISPDGGKPIYTTPADQGAIYWDDGAGLDVSTGMGACWSEPAVCDTGRRNTLILHGLENTGSPAPYQAAQLCYDLVAHGRADWYLPARDELLVLYDNRNAGSLAGTLSSTSYWTSSEQGGNAAVYVNMSDGSVGDGVKYGFQNRVRCVRG